MRIGDRHFLVRSADEYCLLSVRLPKSDQGGKASAEQLIASFHNIAKQAKKTSRLSGALAAHVSLEIVSKLGEVNFYIWAPKRLQSALSNRVREFYPNATVIEQIHDYSKRPRRQAVTATAELVLEARHEIMPIAETIDAHSSSLQAILASISKLDPREEEIWIQILIRPWQGRGLRIIGRSRKGSSLLPSFSVKIRLFYYGTDQRTAHLRLQALAGAFRNFASPITVFKLDRLNFGSDKQLEYTARFFIDKGFILGCRELASIFDLSYSTDDSQPPISTAHAQAPAHVATAGKLPDQLVSLFASATINNKPAVFGIKRKDRSHHLFILGEANTGKSRLLALLMLSDIYYNKGFALIDPHGDLAELIVNFIPKRRYEDVVFFNLSDVDHPIGFNPLELDSPALAGQLGVDLISAVKRLFNDEWGPSVEYILRQAFLALMEFPDATLLDVSRLLKNKAFRRETTAFSKDEELKNFWQSEFDSWQKKYPEAVITVLNRLGDFIDNPVIRSIVGQPTTSFDIRKLMNGGKILIVNLDRRLIGQAAASTLGELLIAKIQLAAAARSSVAAGQVRPFYLYVDDFDNFAADSFSVAISEARRLGLNLTLTNRSLAKITPHVREAIIDNVGSMVCFRINHTEAEQVHKHLNSSFSINDLTSQNHGHCVVSLIVNGDRTAAFRAQLQQLPQPPAKEALKDIVELSRSRYSRNPIEDNRPKLLSQVFHLATKGLAKTHIGKVATSHADEPNKITHHTDDNDNERVINLHK